MAQSWLGSLAISLLVMAVVAGGDSIDCPVMQEWLKLEAVVSRACTCGQVTSVKGNAIDRTTVADNHELLAPLVTHFGNSLGKTS